MSKALVWIRRDIRISDHTALSAACAEHDQVLVLFVFDSKILKNLPEDDKRITFIHEALSELHQDLKEKGSGLNVLFGDPVELVPKFAKQNDITALYYNRDYEPYAVKRDQGVERELKNLRIDCKNFRDHVIFEPHEVLKKDRSPYKVFTPFKNLWTKQFVDDFARAKKFAIKSNNLSKEVPSSMEDHNWMKKMGFNSQELSIPTGRKGAEKKLTEFKKRINSYHETRNLLEESSTSGLSPYVRHGLLSIREVLSLGVHDNRITHEVFVSEIVWREFYQMILSNFPTVEKKCFKLKYESIKWAGGKKELEAWEDGMTGFPIVDAAMRCLNATGLMPNRLRMVTASFLCKTLLVDWKKGEKYFAKKLLDFDLGANNGGWQWSSSSGCDSQPYFRIFNPLSQSKKFDPEGEFIKRWCPELSELDKKQVHAPHEDGPLSLLEKGIDYPAPVVNYSEKRVEALAMYKNAVG